jgi:hypothetical protein
LLLRLSLRFRWRRRSGAWHRLHTIRLRLRLRRPRSRFRWPTLWRLRFQRLLLLRISPLFALGLHLLLGRRPLLLL